MAAAQGAVEYDERGNPVPPQASPAAAPEYDEHGNVIAPTDAAVAQSGLPPASQAAQAALAGLPPSQAAQAPPAATMRPSFAPQEATGVAPVINMRQSPLAPEAGVWNPIQRSFTGMDIPAGQVEVAPGITHQIPAAHLDPNALAAGYPGETLNKFISRPEVQTAAGAIGGLGTGYGLEKTAQYMAPRIAETAFGITPAMRSYGLEGGKIGQAILENVEGSRVPYMAPQLENTVSRLTAEMENAVRNATQTGAVGSNAGVRQALTDIVNDIPRNAPELKQKLQSLDDVLHLGNPNQTQFTPDELLELKRGIGKKVGTWGPEWRNVPDVKAAEEKLYGIVDRELDRIVPGNAERNQTIQAMIHARDQAIHISKGPGTWQEAAAKMAARTGAMIPTLTGAYGGYQKGGLLGAAIGGTAGLIAPIVATSPTTQMAVAKGLETLGSPGVLRTVGGALGAIAPWAYRKLEGQ